MSYSKIVADTFLWKIENFTEEKDVYYSPHFTSKSLDDSEWFLDLHITEYGPNNRKFIDIYLNRDQDEDRKNFNCDRIDITITILANDVSSNIYRKNLYNLFKTVEYSGLRSIVSVEELYAKRNVYLPEDILSVECYLEGHVRDFKIASKSELSETPQKIDCDIKRLGNDLLHMYLNSEFCDIKISTGDRVFSVHKTVICARSPVFNAMFKNDTKEKNSCVIDIIDVDSATMNRMLMYMYSDVVEDMDPKEAEKVYAAADKYEVLPLKKHCSSALKSLISETNLADMYILGDKHQDSDLKTVVEGYVFKHMNNIFKSPEWETFMELNPQLSAELMHKVIMLLGK